MEDDSSYLFLADILTLFSLGQYFNPIDGMVVGGLLLIAVLLVFSALISGSEIAYFSINTDQQEILEKENGKGNKILALIDNPRNLLATILITNTLINIAIIVVAYSITSRWFNFGSSKMLEFLFQVVVVTFLLVLFGEVIPKVYATQQNIKLAKFMATPLSLLSKILSPFSKQMVSSSLLLEKKLAGKNALSTADINQAIDLTIGSNEAERNKDILKGIVQFGNITVKQIMQSRVDIVSATIKNDYQSILKKVRESGYSRFPVYDGDSDNIVGLLYAKDLLAHLNESNNYDWKALLRQPFFVPENKKIDDLLAEFKSRRMHMAIVVDEYGGTSGLVTLEDVLEEIIGEIKDEYDDEKEINFKKINDNNYIFEGKTMINDVCRVLAIDKSTFDEIRGEADSLAGLVLEMNGVMPKSGDVLTFERFKFRIITVNKTRIVKIKVTKE